jgi:hypothetical protein
MGSRLKFVVPEGRPETDKTRRYGGNFKPCSTSSGIFESE